MVGLLLRLPSVNDSLFGDELSTYYIVSERSLRGVVELLDGNSVDLNPPLAFAVAWTFGKLGDAPQLIRLGSLLAGTATIPFTYLLGLWTVGRRAALVGSALVALSPFLIFYSTEARAYGLVLLLGLLSTLALLRALDSGRLAWWAAYAAVSCAVVWTHYPPIFLLVGQFAWAFLTQPGARLRLLTANTVAAVGYLPWLPTVLDNTESPGAKVIAVLHPFGLEAIRLDLGRWAVGHPYLPLESVPGRAALVLLAAGLVAGGVGAALRLRRERTNGERPRLSARVALACVLALSMPVGLALYSAVGDSVWDARNLTVSWPGLALLAGALLTAARGALRVAAVALVVAAFVIGGVQMLRADSQRTPYEEAASFIDRSGAPGDPVVEVPAPSPGPLAPLGDVALAHGEESPKRHPVMRLGAAPLEAQLRARPYEPLPVPPAEAVAAEAVALARGGRLFLVAPGSTQLESLRIPAGPSGRAAGLAPAVGEGPPLALIITVLSPLAEFLDALPARFRAVETRVFPGFLPVSVYVFRDGGGGSAAHRWLPSRRP